MGKKESKESNGEETSIVAKEKEGHNLVGSPTFEALDSGRFKCVETGHELPSHARDSYSQSKHCRLGLIDSVLAKKKPPLNMFLQDPLSRSKLKCKLTGDTINKSEEHIWKHINGRRFLNMIEKKEVAKEMLNGTVKKQGDEKVKMKKKNKDDDLKKEKKKKNKDNGMKKKEQEEDDGNIITEATARENVDLEEDTDFWMPPIGEHWDHDDGVKQGGLSSESLQDNDDTGEEGAEEDKHDAGELSKRTKRMSLEIGPSSFASRKKKRKTSVA